MVDLKLTIMNFSGEFTSLVFLVFMQSNCFKKNVYKMTSRLILTYFDFPIVPDDTIWSEDGKVFVSFHDNKSNNHTEVGYLSNLELYPGKVKWIAITAGNGHEIPLKINE